MGPPGWSAVAYTSNHAAIADKKALEREADTPLLLVHDVPVPCVDWLNATSMNRARAPPLLLHTEKNL